MKSMKYIVAGSVVLGSLLLAGTAFAAEQGGQQGPRGGGRGPGVMGMMMRDGHATSTRPLAMRPGVVGVVASVSGNTVTVTARMPKMGAGDGTHTVSTTTYTVDATNATVFKGSATSTVSGIAVGDIVMVQGTVNGTSVTATKIYDGMPGRLEKGDKGDRKDDKKFHNASTTPRGMTGLPFGNGMPVIGGNVTAVSGNSVTISNKGGVTYTVDVTTAKISKHGVDAATVANIVVGDSVVVQGTFNGTAVTASVIVDQGARPALDTSGNNSDDKGGAFGDKNGGGHSGFGAAVGGFFSHLFGF